VGVGARLARTMILMSSVTMSTGMTTPTLLNSSKEVMRPWDLKVVPSSRNTENRARTMKVRWMLGK
jgi:hypothetical protein